MIDAKLHSEDTRGAIQESFQYQLEMLKLEIESIEKTISRLDEGTQAIKNWAIVTWAGSIAIVLGQQPSLRKHVIFTIVLPVLFWLMDARWRFYIRQFVYRVDKISEYLNDVRLTESFRQQRLVDFIVLDPRGFQYRATEEYKRQVSIWRSLRDPENSIFYLGLMVVSVTLGLFFGLTP